MKTSVLLVVIVLILAGIIYIGFFNDTHPRTVESNHIYIGAIYNGVVKRVNSISANLYFNGGVNLKNIQYYVVLSAWDSNNSYDQIGISSIDGIFYSTYSYTKIINGTIKYFYSPEWFRIGEGMHTLKMYVSSGYVQFSFDGYNLNAHTGGQYFQIASSVVFGQKEYTGLTVYEEIYKFSGKFPRIAFNFSNIVAGNSYNISSFIPLSQNVTNNYTRNVAIYGNTINIYNENPFLLKIKVISGQGSGFLQISDINETISQNRTYTVGLLYGNYTLLIYFKTIRNVNVINMKVFIYKNTWINETLPS